MIDERVETAFQAAFDRAEGAILDTADQNGETVVYTHSFDRRQRKGGWTMSLVSGLLAILAAGILSGATVGASHQAIGVALLPAVALGGIGIVRDAWRARHALLAGARIAAICNQSIVVATPDRRDVAIMRVPLEAVRTVVRNNGAVAIGMVDDQFVLEGLTDPKRFAKEAARCVELAAPHPAAAQHRDSMVNAGKDEDAATVSAIRHRLRDRGWMLASANDYRLGGRWHVFYRFAHPDGLSAKGEGASDADALREAEADASAKERWLADLRSSAA